MKSPRIRLGLLAGGLAVGAAAFFVLRPGPQPTTAQPGPARGARGGIAGIADCNGNGENDADDIAGGASHDCNGNGQPDECETFPPSIISAQQVAGGLILPIAITAPPGDLERLFIVEKNGRIRILDLASGVLQSPPFMAIEDRVDNGEEGGLLGLAFPEDFLVSGEFYVHYSEAFTGDTVVARYLVSTDDPDRADLDSEEVLVVIEQDSASHDGAPLQFGPDGMLYLALGDGGLAFDPENRAQDPRSLLGKVLRLDVDAPPGYVPDDNPFVGDPSTHDLIWAMGLRNPFTMCFDALRGDMYIADVGGPDREEIDFEPAGAPGGRNYGWRCTEGTICSGLGGCVCIDPAHTAPVHEVAHGTGDGTCAIIGGRVYRGCAMPDLAGRYFYSDFCGNYIRSLRIVPDGQGGHTATDVRDHTADLDPDDVLTAVVAFGADAAGELYYGTFFTGTLWKIVPTGVGGAVCGNLLVEPGEACEPPSTANCDCQCQLIPCTSVVFADDFETDLGWTVSGDASADDGRWQRGIPAGCSDVEPAADADGSGRCWLTGNDPCADLDPDGETIITSPVLDLAAGGVIAYRYWINDDPGNPMSEFDSLRVEIATDAAGSSWDTLREYNTPEASWRSDAIEIGVETPASATVRVRFVASDRFADDHVEAAVDAVEVCSPGASAPDCNGNGQPDDCDIARGASADVDGNGVPDECEVHPDTNSDGVVNIMDIITVILAWGPCPAPPPAPCRGDTDSNGIVDVTDLLNVVEAWD